MWDKIHSPYSVVLCKNTEEKFNQSQMRLQQINCFHTRCLLRVAIQLSRETQEGNLRLAHIICLTQIAKASYWLQIKFGICFCMKQGFWILSHISFIGQILRRAFLQPAGKKNDSKLFQCVDISCSQYWHQYWQFGNLEKDFQSGSEYD